MAKQKEKPEEQPEEKTEARKEEPEKMIRVFYRDYRTKLIITPPEKRFGPKSKEDMGDVVKFRKCEGFIKPEQLPLLKANRRYGVHYLSAPDLYALLGSEDPNEVADGNAFLDHMRTACKAHKVAPPHIRLKAVAG